MSQGDISPERVRRADSRGRTNIGWLKSWHSFSFGEYHDPTRTSYRSLRVLNDDIVGPGAGFAEHPHRDMEIITWILEGRLRHRDSTGGGGVLEPGKAQVMSAGTGIRHSEVNASDREPVHLLQLWIIPDQRDHAPRYADRVFEASGRAGLWQTIASGSEADGSLLIHQDASVSVADVKAGSRIDLVVAPDRHAYLHVSTGAVRIDSLDLAAGDALTIDEPGTLTIEATGPGTQLLAFDLS